jgi:hypothetical protein
MPVANGAIIYTKTSILTVIIMHRLFKIMTKTVNHNEKGY